MKKLLLVALSAIIATIGLAGCGASSTTADNSQNNETVLKIAAQPYPLYTPVYVAYKLGYLDEELNAVGAKYEWKSFKSGPLVNEAVAAGEADLGFMADLPAIIAKSNGLPIEIVSNVAYGEKGLAVLVKSDSDIKSISELKGKKVAYATGSYAQHLLALLLSKEGLTLNDVQSINLGAGDQPAALSSGEVDAIVIWEQYISQLTSDGTAKVLADGTGVKKGNMITYALSDYANKNPKVIEAYIKALNRANEVIKNNPEQAADAVADDFGVSKDLMLKIIPNFTYSTEFTNNDIAEITKVKDFSLESGIIKSDVDINSFINKKYLEAIKQ